MRWRITAGWEGLVDDHCIWWRRFIGGVSRGGGAGSLLAGIDSWAVQGDSLWP
jgi:hypothetical protein